MNIQVRGKNIEITPALKDYVAKRIGKVSRYFDDLGDISAILTVEKGRHIVEVTVPVQGMVLRGEEATSDMYTSIDLVIEKIERQIRKYKTRLARRIRGNAFKDDLVPVAREPEKDDSNVVKTKRFIVKPMSAEEAIMEMNLVNHDFFVFMDAESEKINVVYRRKDGQYGLIDPEIG